jgi:hypothetical protein
VILSPNTAAFSSPSAAVFSYNSSLSSITSTRSITSRTAASLANQFTSTVTTTSNFLISGGADHSFIESRSADIQSLGVILYVMLTSSMAFGEPRIPTVLQRIFYHDPHCPTFLTETDTDLLPGLLDPDPQSRPALLVLRCRMRITVVPTTEQNAIIESIMLSMRIPLPPADRRQSHSASIRRSTALSSTRGSITSSSAPPRFQFRMRPVSVPASRQCQGTHSGTRA